MPGTIQLISDDGSISYLSPANVSTILEALDNSVVARDLTVPPNTNADDFYDSIIALKTQLIPFS